MVSVARAPGCWGGPFSLNFVPSVGKTGHPMGIPPLWQCSVAANGCCKIEQSGGPEDPAATTATAPEPGGAKGRAVHRRAWPAAGAAAHQTANPLRLRPTKRVRSCLYWRRPRLLQRTTLHSCPGLSPRPHAVLRIGTGNARKTIS